MFDADVRDIADEEIGLTLRARARAPRRVAALDIGSRSFHLAIAELRGSDDFEIVTRVKECVFVGDSVFSCEMIDTDTFQRGVAAVRRLREIALEFTPVAITAVATSAVREASNGDLFVRAIHARSGIEVRIIDGLEEARLALLGARRELGPGVGRVALVDFGAGSTEVVVADAERCHFMASLPLGALRLKARLGRGDIRDPQHLRRLHDQVSVVLGPTLKHVRELGIDELVLSCGTARRLLKLATATAGGETSARLQRLDLARVQALAQGGPAAAAAVSNLDDGEDLLVGAVALGVLFDLLKVSDARVVRAGLREGLVTDYLSRARSSLRLHDGLVSFAMP